MIGARCFSASLPGNGSVRIFSCQLARRRVVSMSAKEGSPLLRIPGTIGKLQMTMALVMKPDHDQAVQHQRHRRRAAHGLFLAVGRVFQPQQLFAVFEGHLDRPPPGIGRRICRASQSRRVQ